MSLRFSANYLANIPEIVDLARATKARFPEMLVCVGGHSASFTRMPLSSMRRGHRLRAEGGG